MKSIGKLVTAVIIFMLMVMPVFVFAGGQQDTAKPAAEKENTSVEAKPFKLAVVVPGVTAGSPCMNSLLKVPRKLLMNIRMLQ